jgi:hypothetical protein
MAAKFIGSTILDKGLEYFEANCNRLDVISAYTLGDSYATVIGNTLGNVAMTGADFAAITTVNSYDRRVTVSAKNVTATGTNASPDLHVALLDTTNSLVLAIVEEISNQPITTGNTINVPSFTVDGIQPV